jgi:hypothetical protein
MVNNGGQAFPSFERLRLLKSVGISEDQKETIFTESSGMTLRDYFAAKAMQGLASHYYSPNWTGAEIAKSAYAIADTMLKESQK